MPAKALFLCRITPSGSYVQLASCSLCRASRFLSEHLGSRHKDQDLQVPRDHQHICIRLHLRHESPRRLPPAAAFFCLTRQQKSLPRALTAAPWRHGIWVTSGSMDGDATDSCTMPEEMRERRPDGTVVKKTDCHSSVCETSKKKGADRTVAHQGRIVHRPDRRGARLPAERQGTILQERVTLGFGQWEDVPR